MLNSKGENVSLTLDERWEHGQKARRRVEKLETTPV